MRNKYKLVSKTFTQKWHHASAEFVPASSGEKS